MKRYKVLEAHQGDKLYLPNDPETGTRIADPNAVAHLVTLGLLEEIGDVVADVVEDERLGGADADLVEFLTRERDDARLALQGAEDTLGSVRTAAENDLRAAHEQFTVLTGERDAANSARQQAEELLAAARQEVTALTQQVATLEGQLSAKAGEAEGEAGGDQGGTSDAGDADADAQADTAKGTARRRRDA